MLGIASNCLDLLEIAPATRPLLDLEGLVDEDQAWEGFIRALAVHSSPTGRAERSWNADVAAFWLPTM